MPVLDLPIDQLRNYLPASTDLVDRAAKFMPSK